MQIKLLAAALLGVTTAALPLQAQTAPAPAASTAAPVKNLTMADLQALRAELRSSKKRATAETLSLTEVEATKFWPIYDQYVIELSKIKEVKYALVVEYVNGYGKIDDKAATSFITRWLEVASNEDALRARYVPIVGKVLPGIKTATFFQIDRRLNMVLELKLASELPILQLQTHVVK